MNTITFIGIILSVFSVILGLSSIAFDFFLMKRENKDVILLQDEIVQLKKMVDHIMQDGDRIEAKVLCVEGVVDDIAEGIIEKMA